MLKINPNLEIQVSKVSDDHLCVVVDDFLLNPLEAVEFASTHKDEFVMLERAYPGVVLPVENRMLDEINRFIQKEMSRLFPFCRGGDRFSYPVFIGYRTAGRLHLGPAFMPLRSPTGTRAR